MVGPLAALQLPWSLRKAVGAWKQTAAPVEVALQSCKCGMDQEHSFSSSLNRMEAVEQRDVEDKKYMVVRTGEDCLFPPLPPT